MSWTIEQSDDAAAVGVSGDTVTCNKDGYYGSPINVLYNDPANHNGQYFWQIEFPELQESGGASVGLTTERGFVSGWGLKAMKYLGNLSDGGALLVASFGDSIAQNDKVGILLQLSDAELKMFIFHNERPLGLAFHLAAPYPKPLFPVISFNANGKVKISRSQAIPKSLQRAALVFTGIEGHWKIVDYPTHPTCIGYQFEISRQDQNTYGLHAHVCNSLNCTLTYNPSNNQYHASPVMSTMMMGPPEEMANEQTIGGFIPKIQHLETQGNQTLTIRTSGGEQMRLERFEVPPPTPVTNNIFA